MYKIAILFLVSLQILVACKSSKKVEQVAHPSQQKVTKISYIETKKLELKLFKGLNMGDNIPSTVDSKYELTFDQNASIYQKIKNTSGPLEMESDDGSIKMVIQQDNNPDILYTDLSSGAQVHRKTFMGKEFLVSSKEKKPEWKVSNEKIKYLGYVCRKATAVQTVEKISKEGEKESVDEEIVAWFTTEIPISTGPQVYTGLPGVVLMVSIDEGKTEIKAQDITPEVVIAKPLQRPTAGQKVSKEEYLSIQKEKTKEMINQYKRKGGIIIRG